MSTYNLTTTPAQRATWLRAKQDAQSRIDAAKRAGKKPDPADEAIVNTPDVDTAEKDRKSVIYESVRNHPIKMGLIHK